MVKVRSKYAQIMVEIRSNMVKCGQNRVKCGQTAAADDEAVRADRRVVGPRRRSVPLALVKYMRSKLVQNGVKTGSSSVGGTASVKNMWSILGRNGQNSIEMVKPRSKWSK